MHEGLISDAASGTDTRKWNIIICARGGESQPERWEPRAQGV